MNVFVHRPVGIAAIAALVACGASAGGSAVSAASADSTAAVAPDGGHPARQPPPEAVQACGGKSAGDACTVQFHDRTLTGTCRATPDGQTVACRPAPPQAAIDACAGRAAGDACSFSFGGRDVTGACAVRPDESTEVCRPAHGPGHHGEHGR